MSTEIDSDIQLVVALFQEGQEDAKILQWPKSFGWNLELKEAAQYIRENPDARFVIGILDAPE